MNRLETWLLTRIIRREVRQDYNHAEKITNLYRMINNACQEEFTEDNIPTLNHSLTEWFNDSLPRI